MRRPGKHQSYDMTFAIVGCGPTTGVSGPADNFSSWKELENYLIKEAVKIIQWSIKEAKQCNGSCLKEQGKQNAKTRKKNPYR